MASGGEKDVEVLFSDEELNEISGLKRGADFVEVTCGCTSHRYGDAVGRLRIFGNGDLEITCECTPGCQEDKLTPAAFEKHSERETARKWKSNVWVIDKALKTANGSQKSHNGKTCHRDEFLRCTRCNKVRRFRLRSKEECRIYHDASLDCNWKCSDLKLDRHRSLVNITQNFPRSSKDLKASFHGTETHVLCLIDAESPQYASKSHVMTMVSERAAKHIEDALVPHHAADAPLVSVSGTESE
ncbi:Protein ULTRAPETALA 1 [Acorus calamus]|uniref:Protein ULTRAPETALA 1 n=1 Tax=Acorus calamus TaxID=4465 RepID=A0AAV9DTA5_ACOCL|nr:Protein ULTRAPETALA 1 [Acorus calamus]